MSWTVIILAVLLLWFWWDGLGARELARSTCVRHCKQHDVAFLDDTVALAKIRLRRDAGGRLRFLRRFNFEFTSDGEMRYQGYIELLGRRVCQVHLDAYRIH